MFHCLLAHIDVDVILSNAEATDRHYSSIFKRCWLKRRS